MTSVELVPWPRDEARRLELEATGRPRLLLVEPGGPAPVVVDRAEDWIRLPSEQGDVEARMASLRVRNLDRPQLDDDGFLGLGGRRVALAEVEARLIGPMLDRFGRLTDRRSLAAAGWPGEEPSRNLLDVQLHRLRQRIEPVGLRVRTVRKRGYILDFAATEPGFTEPGAAGSLPTAM